MWEIDVDAGSFGMGMDEHGGIFVRWPWKSLYLQSIGAFEQEAQMHEEQLRKGYVISRTPFSIIYKLILLQAYVRRFIVLRKAVALLNQQLH